MAIPGTPKTRARLESEIERNREESNWNRCIELANQLGNDQPQLIQFLLGEAKLEKCLDTTKDANSILLSEAKRHLASCLNTSSPSPLAMDANLLLAKACYTSGDYDQALKHIELSNIDNVSAVEKALPLRVMKLVAESFAVKGMALEKTNKTDGFDKRINCLVKATDLGLRYLQNVEKQQGPYVVASLGPILDHAIQRTPIVYMQNGEVDKGCTQYRHAVNACETPSTLTIRQILCRQLAEVLLRGISRSAWKKFETPKKSTSGPWKPHRYFGQSLFIPHQKEEEILLLLLISEMLAARNVVLDRNQEFSESRTQSLHNVMAVYDLITITLTPFKYYLFDFFERAMKFSFEVKHIWFQFALTLMESKKSLRAFQLFQEVARIDKTDPLPCLLAAKLCIQELNQSDEALKMAKEALNRCNPEHFLFPKINLILGIIHALLYEDEPESIKRVRVNHLAESLKFLKETATLCPRDHLAHFHIALHMARQRAISESIKSAKIALTYSPHHLPTIKVLILCLSARKQYQDALILCEAALEEYPGHLILLYIKVRFVKKV